jgi:hypothetical protein
MLPFLWVTGLTLGLSAVAVMPSQLPMSWLNGENFKIGIIVVSAAERLTSETGPATDGKMMELG